MRIVRAVAWVVIVAIAAFQAYAQRYAVSPDGISYLDLSDAVGNGRLSGLVNLYWSPLYPFLIGVGRLVAGGGPAVEVPVAHAVNFAAFIGLLAAYEYFLFPVLELAAATPRSLLRGVRGAAVAYALFGFLALTMTPLELTTPDVLAGAAALLSLGALFRLARAARGHGRAHAVALGLALGLGALAKSFMVPWAIVCFATLVVVTRRRGAAQTALACGVWAAILIPWCAVLSHQAGRLTFGDSGRLTYVWYVNEQDAPSLGGVPPGARTASSDAILPGVGITGDAPGTDPMWLDPLRWNAMLTPHWDLRQQLGTLKVFELFYLQQFTPLVFLIFLIVVAPFGTRRKAWQAGWIVLIPALAGLLAYAMVVSTARYIMPFVLATTLIVLATIPVARRFVPWLALVGLAIPAGLESLDMRTAAGLGVVAALLGGVLAGVLVPARRRILWMLAVAFAALVSHVVLAPLGADVLPFPVLALVAVFWILARGAERDDRAESFALRSELAMAVVLGLIFVIRFENRLSADFTALARAASPKWGNVSVRIAADLASHGIGPGMRIAVIGPHAEAYWARAGRLHIVADVPRPLVDRFWGLPAAQQDSLIAQFAAAGAAYAVASMPPSGTPAAPVDSRWTPVKFGGWVRPLGAP